MRLKKGESQRRFTKQAERAFLGKLLAPIFPDFIPWRPHGTDGWEKAIHIQQPYLRRYTLKIPVLVMDVIEKKDFGKYQFPLTYFDLSDEFVWLKCLWEDEIVYHRVSITSFFKLKNLVMEIGEYQTFLEMQQADDKKK